MKFFSLCFTALALLLSLRPTEVNAQDHSMQLKEGRIVINVRDDGSYTGEDFEPLADEKAITAYVQKKKKLIEGRLGRTSRLHLRGSTDAVLKHGRIAIRGAAAAGVNQVLFATFDPPEKKPEPAKPDKDAADADEEIVRIQLKPHLMDMFINPNIKPRESNLNLKLPPPSPRPGPAAGVKPFAITIKGDGRIFHDKALLDADPKKRELPLLEKELRFYKQGVDAAGEPPHVQICAEDEAEHQRVIDVLNALAAVDIKSVSFTDLTDKDEEEEK